MLQLNKYKKVCHLTDSEKEQINDFFKTMFEVDRITDIKICVETCEIEGFEEDKSRKVGSVVKHDKNKDNRK